MFVNFFNAFMSYFLLMVIIVAVAGIATAIGITMARKKNANTAAGYESSKHS